MDSAIWFFTNNWLTIILFVIGIPISIFIGATFSNRKQFSCHVNTKKVYIDNIGKHNNKLKITYDGEIVDTMYQTQFYIWNSGNQTIDKSDIVDSPLLTISNGKILDISITAISRKQCKINYAPISVEESKIVFDFLDKNDGACINILHTNKLDFAEPVFKGTKIKNCKEISQYFSFNLKSKIFLNIFNFLLTIMVFCLDYFLILSGVETFSNIQSYETLEIMFYVVFLLIFIILSVMFLKFYLPSQYANKVPQLKYEGEN